MDFAPLTVETLLMLIETLLEKNVRFSLSENSILIEWDVSPLIAS